MNDKKRPPIDVSQSSQPDGGNIPADRASAAPPPQQKALSILEQQVERATIDITRVLEDCAIEQIKELPQMVQMVKLAKGMGVLRRSLTDEVVRELFMPLMGSPLGFRTDLDEKEERLRYGIEVVRDCACEALIRGFQIVGNEFNIIARRSYFTKEGFTRKVNEFPGITDLDLRPGMPHVVSDKGAAVPYHASWKVDGQYHELICDMVPSPHLAGKLVDRRIPVRVNGGMGTDAILGKARRKILAMIWERLNGVKWSVPDGDASDGSEVITVAGTAVQSQVPATSQIDELLKKTKKGEIDQPWPSNTAGANPPAAEAGAAAAEPLSEKEALQREIAEQDAKDRADAEGASRA